MEANRRVSTKELILVKRELDLLSKHHNSLKGIVKSHTTKIDTVEKTVRQNKTDADAEFNSIHTKHNQLEHATDTRVAAVETSVAEQKKLLNEELAFVNKNYDKTSDRLDELKISVTHIEDGTTVLPGKSAASDELKDSFKDAIVEAVTKLYATGVLGSPQPSTGLTIPGQPPPANANATGTAAGTQSTEAAAIRGACNYFANATNDSMPATVTHDFSTEKKLQQIITTQCLSRHITPEFAIIQVFLRSSSPVHILTLLFYTQDGYYIMQQAYNVAYENMLDTAITYCPNFFTIQADGHKYLIVNRNQILTIGSEGRQYVEDQLAALAKQFTPHHSRDANDPHNPFFDWSSFLRPGAIDAYCKAVAHILVIYVTPKSRQEESTYPILYDLRKALELPLPGTQLLMYVYNKITSFAPHNLTQVLTALKTLISSTLSQYTEKDDPLYLISFMCSLLDQTSSLKPPNHIDPAALYDQTLTVLRRFFPAKVARDPSQGWNSQVAQILDAQTNPQSYSQDINDFSKFCDLHRFKTQLEAAGIKFQHDYTRESACPVYLLHRDLLNEVRTVDAKNTPAKSHRGRSTERPGQDPSGTPHAGSRFRRRSLSPGKRRQQLLAGSSAVEPEMDSAEADEYEHLADADESEEDLFYSALGTLVRVAREQPNPALIEVFNVAGSAFEQAEAYCEDSEGEVDMYTATLLHAYATAAENSEIDDGLPFTNFLGWVASYIHRQKSPKPRPNSRRAPQAIRKGFHKARRSLPPDTTSYKSGKAVPPGSNPKASRDAKKHPAFRNRHTPRRLFGPGLLDSPIDRNPQRVDLLSLLKSHLRFLEAPCPQGFDPVRWARTKALRSIKSIQDIILRLTSNVPRHRHVEAIKTISANWSYTPPDPFDIMEMDAFVAGESDSDDDATEGNPLFL